MRGFFAERDLSTCEAVKQLAQTAESHKVTLLSEHAAVTSVAPAAESETDPLRQPGLAAFRGIRLGDVAGLVAGLWWALPLTHATGGRSASHEGVLIGLLVVSAVLIRPWSVLPRIAVLIPCWISLAALLVPALAPTGWRGADDAASYVCAAMAFLVAAGWAQTSTRRVLLVAAVALAGLDQVCGALLPWWGGGDPSAQLSGTFYWHNPFAAFLLPAAVLGVALVTWRLRPLHLVGWFATPLCAAGIVYSSSRATLGVLVVALLGCSVLAARAADRRRLLARWSAISAVSLAVVYALPGPPLFAHRVSPFASSAARSAAGESLSANGGYRVEFWKSALETLRHHPLVGSGYHGLIETSQAYTPGGWARSNLAHNGYLQAFSDGGLLLGIPVLLGSLLLICVAGRVLIRGLRCGQIEPLTAVGSIALLAALAHSAVDFDWSHSALFVMDALVGAVICSRSTTGTTEKAAAVPVNRPRLRFVGAAVVALMLLGVGMSALGTRDGDESQTSDQSKPVLVARWTAQAERPLGSDVAAKSLLALSVTNPSAVVASQRRLVLAKTAREAKVDLKLATERAQVAVQLGDRSIALALLPRLRSVEASRPAYATELAPLLAALGQEANALRVLQGPATDAVRSDNAAALAAVAESYVAIQGPASAPAACLLSEAKTDGSCNIALLAVR